MDTARMLEVMGTEPTLKVVNMQSVRAKKLQFLWPGVAPKNKVTICVVDAGIGKSQ